MRRAGLVVVVLVLGAAAAPAEGRAPLVTKASIAEAKRWAQQRDGMPSFAVVMEDGTVRGLHRSRTYPAASVTKAMLMVAVLRAARGRELTAAERARLRPMIEESSNKAARALFASHGPAALQAVARRAGMQHFGIALSLFEARIAAGDQARFFARIDRLVPRRHRAYARELLNGIVERQRWGIAPVAEDRALTPYFKGGWRTELVHQVALLERGNRRIALAVLTSGAKQPYGRRIVQGIAKRVLAAPRR